MIDQAGIVSRIAKPVASEGRAAAGGRDLWPGSRKYAEKPGIPALFVAFL